MGAHIGHEAFAKLFASGKPVRISEIGSRLGTSRTTAARLMARHGTYTCVNNGGYHCVLSSMCRFDENGFCRIGKFLFFRDGNQRDAVCRCIESSEAGMDAGEIGEFFGVGMAMQLLRLSREERVRREKLKGVFVYFSADDKQCARQLERRRKGGSTEEARQTVAEMLVGKDRESLELLVKVLLTCLTHPEFSAKSVALSLARRGESICTAQVKRMFEQFDLAKKGGGGPPAVPGPEAEGGNQDGAGREGPIHFRRKRQQSVETGVGRA